MAVVAGVLVLWTATVSAFRCSSMTSNRSVSICAVANNHEKVEASSSSSSSERFDAACQQRRRFMSSVAISAAGAGTSSLVNPSIPSCNCCLLSVPSAAALADLTPPSSNAYDPSRNQFMDSIFSWSMATTMDGYEAEARPYKAQLFESLFDYLARGEGNEVPVVVEVGMGTFPNAPFFARSMQSSGLKSLDIIGVDPNDSMKTYALDNAQKSGLLSKDVSLRVIHGVAEALPFADGSVDAVIVTLTLCSVSNPERAISEIKRILKPGTGKFIFWEHVLSSDPGLALQQQILSPIQTIAADGCHLNRETGSLIQDAGFKGGVDLRNALMKTAHIIGPTVYGIASA